MNPKYPVYIPSKGRYENCLTAKMLDRDDVPYTLVVEPSERDEYASRFGADKVVVLPWDGDDDTRREFCEEREIENGGLIAVRNWIKERSTEAGDKRHWQIDDNIRKTYRWYKTKRIPCHSGLALRVCEKFVDRYKNVAVAGLEYSMFATTNTQVPPFNLNQRVYSCSLILNEIPHRWRIKYNDDVDLCLQVIADGWCTVQLNAFLVDKQRTMTIEGGNTDDLYQGDGRLRMARSLERKWPGVVTVGRRFGRPQHFVYDEWQRFDNQLEYRDDVNPSEFEGTNEFGMRLNKKRTPNSERMARMADEFNAKRAKNSNE